MQKLFLRAIALAPLLIIVIACNYFIDPANLIRKDDYTNKIAAVLSQGLDYKGSVYFNDRLLTKSLIEFSDHIDVLILGSSRSNRERIPPAVFRPANALNASCRVATLQDHIAIYGLCENANVKPTHVLICADAWLLNENNTNDIYAWQDIKEGMRYAEENGIVKHGVFSLLADHGLLIQHIKQLVSLKYFQISIRALLSGKLARDENEDLIVFDPDTMDTGVVKRVRTVEEVEQHANYLSQRVPMYSHDNFNRLSPNLMRTFEKFVDYLLSKNIEVSFFLSPYYYTLYDNLIVRIDTKAIVDAENYFRRIATEKKIEIYGSYNPRLLPISKYDFSDAWHIYPSAVEKLLANFIRRINPRL